MIATGPSPADSAAQAKWATIDVLPTPPLSWNNNRLRTSSPHLLTSAVADLRKQITRDRFRQGQGNGSAVTLTRVLHAILKAVRTYVNADVRASMRHFCSA